MKTVGTLLVVAGLGAVLLGALLLALARLGLDRLPGDVVLRRGNVVFYAPLGLSVLLSLVLTVVLTLLARR